MKRPKTRKQRTKYGKRMKREIIGKIHPKATVQDMEHVIPLLLESSDGVSSLNVAFTACRGNGQAVSIGLCDDDGQLTGAIHLMAEHAALLMGQVAETITGGAQAMKEAAGATVH